MCSKITYILAVLFYKEVLKKEKMKQKFPKVGFKIWVRF